MVSCTTLLTAHLVVSGHLATFPARPNILNLVLAGYSAQSKIGGNHRLFLLPCFIMRSWHTIVPNTEYKVTSHGHSVSRLYARNVVLLGGKFAFILWWNTHSLNVLYRGLPYQSNLRNPIQKWRFESTCVLANLPLHVTITSCQCIVLIFARWPLPLG